MKVLRDGKGQPYIEWFQGEAEWGHKRAWVQRKTEPDKDWAGTGRYINVVQTNGKRPGGVPADFPIFSSLPDEQVLTAFVAAVCAITGCPLPDGE